MYMYLPLVLFYYDNKISSSVECSEKGVCVCTRFNSYYGYVLSTCSNSSNSKHLLRSLHGTYIYNVYVGYYISL